MEYFQCEFCSVVKYSLKKYLTHLELLHEHTSDFKSVCCFCKKQYKTVYSLRNHYYTKHVESIRKKTIDEDVPGQNDTSFLDENCLVDFDETPDTPHNMSVYIISVETLLKNLKEHLIQFLLKLQEKHVLPGVVKETVFNDVKFLLNYFVENYQQVLKFHLEQSSFNFEDNEDLQRLLNDEDLFETALSNIVTDHQLTQYCQDSLGLIEPVQVHLGTDENDKLESFQYIPILKVCNLS